MKAFMLLICLVAVTITEAREWKNLRQHRKLTAQDSLAPADWLKKDRKRSTKRWTDANQYNMSCKDGYAQYPTFLQKRDFYRWLNTQLEGKGHDVRWPAVAYIVTKRLCYLDSRFVQRVIVRNHTLISFIQECNNLILMHVYSDFSSLYDSETTLTGVDARNWDATITYKEQCTILDSVYARQPEKVINKLNRMAHGRGIYRIAMPRKLQMKNDISKCKNRCDYGLNIISKYYEAKYAND